VHSTHQDADWRPLVAKLAKKTYNALRDKTACPD
jgi:hypothetical protein